MDLTVCKSRLKGSIAVPGSKSHTIRGVAAAMLADGVSLLRAPLRSADTLSVLKCAEALGLKVEVSATGDWMLTGHGGALRDPGRPLDLGNSGTGLRFLVSIAALAAFPVTLDGDASLRTRPLKGLLDSLAQLGAHYAASPTGGAPVSITGPIGGGHAEVDGTTSQFTSSLLFALPFAKCDSVLDLDFLNEKPYVGITLDWLERLNIAVRHSEDLLHFEIPGGQTLRPFERTIPADFSTAAFPLGAALLAGDGVEIRNLDFTDVQGDKAVFDIFRRMGAVIEQDFECFIPGSSRLHGIDVDLNAVPDALPLIAAVAATLPGETTRFLNVPQARLKETDRISGMAQELAKLGVECEELPDGLIVRGAKWRGGRVDSRGDHRIAMALATAALNSEAPVTISGAECAEVTYPDFVRDFRQLGADFSCR